MTKYDQRSLQRAGIGLVLLFILLLTYFYGHSIFEMMDLRFRH